MERVGIFRVGALVVDCTLEAWENAIIVALVNEEWRVKCFVASGDESFLMPEDARYNALPSTREMDFRVWGVATCVIHRLR